MTKAPKSLMAHGLVVLPDQLFDVAHLQGIDVCQVLCREDMGLMGHETFHHQRTIFYLAAMRSHADALAKAGYQVTHQPLARSNLNYGAAVVAWCQKFAISHVHTFEIINKNQRGPLLEALEGANIMYIEHPSPMFLTSGPQFRAYLKSNTRPFMRTFYERQRKRLNVLVHADERPEGGRWSFDEDNRKPLPASVALPDIPAIEVNAHVKAAQAACDALFPDHPGQGCTPWLPVTRKGALQWLQSFLEVRFHAFGPYEDALSHRGDVLFHSVLTPFLNSGLLTPAEVLERALRAAKRENVPLQSLEGFVRQIIGWREFIRGIYDNFSGRQESQNFFKHTRRLSPHWYEGGTGVPPLDDALNKVRRLGWAHHIERLMVLGNLMLLLQVHPHEAHRWFLEMFVDAQEWVMGPNVYGMALFSDGGLFATKPYICGSNYYRKMGGYPKGPWCDGVDGLYWRFIERHRALFDSNQRMSWAARSLDRMAPARKVQIYEAADQLTARLTVDGV